MSKHISILGICCSRDIFSTHENDGDYIIDRFVQSVNPLSAVSETPLVSDIFDEAIEGKPNFYKRCISLDLTKKVFDYLFEVQSDYLIIDAGSFRKSLFFAEDDLSKCATLIFPETAEILKKNARIGEFTVGDIYNFSKEMFDAAVQRYFNRIKDTYAEKQIIVIEHYEVDYYIVNGK